MKFTAFRIAVLFTSLSGCVIGGSSSKDTSAATDPLTGSGATDQGNAELTWSPDVLLFTSLDVEFAALLALTLENTGDSSLKIDTIQIVSTQQNHQPGAFFVGEYYEGLVIDPGMRSDVDIVVQLLDNSAAFAELVIRSNDTENPILRIPLCAYPSFSTDTPCPIESTDDTGE